MREQSSGILRSGNFCPSSVFRGNDLLEHVARLFQCRLCVRPRRRYFSLRDCRCVGMLTMEQSIFSSLEILILPENPYSDCAGMAFFVILFDFAEELSAPSNNNK